MRLQPVWSALVLCSVVIPLACSQSSIVDGDVVILATDATTNGTPRLVENAIQAVLNSVQGRTGMYISLGCAYQDASAPMAVTLLEPFGSFKVQGVPGCAASGHLFKMYPPVLSQDMGDPQLAGSGCVARSVFTYYPERNFSIAALAVSTPEQPVPGETVYSDVLMRPGEETSFVSTPYVLVRGAAPLGAGCGLSEAPLGEECDLGSGGIDQHGVLYNFVDAASISAHGFGFWGTVLAPYAHVSFSNGSWDGGMYALSLTGNAEGHINPLNDRDICP